MLHLYYISSCIIYNLLALPLPFTHRHISFTLDLSVERYLTLCLHTDNGPLLVWESSITINIGHPYIANNTGRKVHRFSITNFHSEHYVRLAARLARRCPWLAEYRWADTDGYMNYFIGRIKPFNWQCLSERMPTKKLEHYK